MNSEIHLFSRRPCFKIGLLSLGPGSLLCFIFELTGKKNPVAAYDMITLWSLMFQQACVKWHLCHLFQSPFALVYSLLAYEQHLVPSFPPH